MEKAKFHGWEYISHARGERIVFEVIPDKPLVPPSSLCKYYPITKYSIEALENNTVYVAQTNDFNDLFDANPALLDFNSLTFEDVVRLVKGAMEESKLIEWWKDDRADLLGYLKHSIYGVLQSKLGILCTTPNYLNELMCGYYNNNQGFLIDFDYHKFHDNFMGPFPVNYVPELSPLDITNLGGKLTMLIQSTIKKSIWKHENEYRFLIQPSGTDFKVKDPYGNSHVDYNWSERIEGYPADAIKAIYIGFKFLEGDTDSMEVVGEWKYKIEFTSGKAELKSKLLDAIIEQKILCYNIVQQVKPTMELKTEIWEFTKLGEFKYQIDRSKRKDTKER